MIIFVTNWISNRIIIKFQLFTIVIHGSLWLFTLVLYLCIEVGYFWKLIEEK